MNPFFCAQVLSPIRRLALALSWSAAMACGARAELKVLSQWPQGANVCIDAPLRITFNQEPFVMAQGRVEIKRLPAGETVDVIEFGGPAYVDRYGMGGGYALRSNPVSIEGKTAVIRPHAHALKYGESYEVYIHRGAFQEFERVPEGWTFETRPAPARNPGRLVVAADGSADFCTVQGAVDQIEPHRTKPAEIFVRKGTYDGLIRIQRERTHIRLIGEDRKATVLTAVNNDKLNPGWIQRSVLGVEADDFTLENLTVRNATPFKGSQAEAVYINAQRCALKNADFESFQDTLHLSGGVDVSDCRVSGDVDFIWGYGSAVFERCELRALHDGYFVQARNPAGRAGYFFINCIFSAAPGLKTISLARIEPGRFPASQITLINCRIGPQISPAGWQITGEGPTGALRFEEFHSMDLKGKPLDISRRHPASKQLTAADAARIRTAGAKAGAAGDDCNPASQR